MAAVQRRVIVYGGNGALGKVCVSFFKGQSWWVGSIDLAANGQADANVSVTPSDSWQAQTEQVASGVKDVLEGAKVDALICVAGGWAGGSSASKDFVKNSDMMWKQSVWTSVISAQLASKHLKDGGLLALTGAKAALEGTPGMIGYGMAKASVHQLVQSLSTKAGGLPEGATAVAILPVTLDTEMNRKFMPDADRSEWTPLEFVSELMYKWSNDEDRPASGSLIQLITSNGKTDLIKV